MVMKFYLYGTLMINHGNRILILLHFYCNSKHELSTILIDNVANLSRFVTLTDFDSKHNSSHFVYLSVLTISVIGLLPLLDIVRMNLAQ